METLTIYCHNILADAWVNFSGDGGRAFYGDELYHKGLLDAPMRHKLVFAKVVESEADIVCLQEVGLSECSALWSSELPKLYHVTGLVENAVSSAREPNGTLILLKRGVMHPEYHLLGVQLNGTTGASMVRCRRLEGFAPEVVVVNCHLDGGKQGITQGQQIMQLLEESQSSGAAVVWCGDFNKKPNDLFFEEVRQQGYKDAFDFREDLYSCALGQCRLDYVLFKGCINCVPNELKATKGSCLLGKFKDKEELLREVGSDHAPLMVAFSVSTRGSLP